MHQRVVDCAEEVRRVLYDHGHQAGHFHVLGPDAWNVVWNSDRSGFAAFLEGRHAILAWRSPVSQPDERADLLARLVARARSFDKPLFAVLVDDTTRNHGRDMGLHATWVGTESFLSLPEWGLNGGRRQKVRWARNHAAASGYEWREVFPQSDHDARRDLAAVEVAWKGERRQRRTDSFQRTSFLELGPIRRYFAAVAGTQTTAFCACTPINSTSWYLQDVVRTPDSPRGALEGAIALALETLRDDGFAVASNGPIPFWRPDGEDSEVDQLGRIGRGTIRFFDGQYRFSGVSQFRNKFTADAVVPLYVLRTHKAIGPLAARSLVRLLTKRSGPIQGTGEDGPSLRG